jgi:hypothetical protein
VRQWHSAGGGASRRRCAYGHDHIRRGPQSAQGDRALHGTLARTEAAGGSGDQTGREPYITDASQRVTVVSPERKVLRRWGGAGKARGEFDFVPHDQGRPNVSAAIAVGRDGRVYVDDSGEVFAVGEDGSILRLRVSRPGA